MRGAHCFLPWLKFGQRTTFSEIFPAGRIKNLKCQFHSGPDFSPLETGYSKPWELFWKTYGNERGGGKYLAGAKYILLEVEWLFLTLHVTDNWCGLHGCGKSSILHWAKTYWPGEQKWIRRLISRGSLKCSKMIMKRITVTKKFTAKFLRLGDAICQLQSNSLASLSNRKKNPRKLQQTEWFDGLEQGGNVAGKGRVPRRRASFRPFPRCRHCLWLTGFFRRAQI